MRKIIKLEEVLVENSTYHRGCLKRRLINEGVLENKCDICGLLPKWNNKLLVMVIDHINGINNDNRIENLRLLCPNCNSQTDTFSGRNTKRIKAERKCNNCARCGVKIYKKSTKCINCSNIKFKNVPAKDILQKLVSTMPITKIAEKYGVSDVSVIKWCKKYDIDRPGRGYWSKKTRLDS